MIEKKILEDFVRKGYTKKQVSDELGIGYSTVYRYMSHHGLKFTVTEKTKRIRRSHLCECGETNPTKFYGTRKTKCKKCWNIQTAEKGRENKRKGIAYLGGECENCGYKKNADALDFHHKDPSTKEDNYRSRVGWKRLKKELDKCMLLCANCHREIHSINGSVV